MKQDVRHLRTFQALPEAYVAMEKQLLADAAVDPNISTVVTGKMGAGANQHVIQYSKDIAGMCKHFKVDTILNYGGTGSGWDNVVSEPAKTTLTASLGARTYLGFDLLGDQPAPDNADAVVCCDVLEHIYVGEIGTVIEDIFARANKMVVTVRSDCSAAAWRALLMPIIANGHYGAADGHEEGRQATDLV